MALTHGIMKLLHSKIILVPVTGWRWNLIKVTECRAWPSNKYHAQELKKTKALSQGVMKLSHVQTILASVTLKLDQGHLISKLALQISVMHMC